MAAADMTADVDLAEVYRDLHAHPELGFTETRTAGIVAGRLRSCGYETATGVGGTGVVGVLRNGTGPAVLLRADMDALPVREETGLAYASTATGVDRDGHDVPLMHACGHDMHVTCLLGSAAALAADRGSWQGTLMLVFQPAEEVGGGAQAMVDDGLFERFGRRLSCSVSTSRRCRRGSWGCGPARPSPPRIPSGSSCTAAAVTGPGRRPRWTRW